jgi:hypothetical protein
MDHAEATGMTLVVTLKNDPAFLPKLVFTAFGVVNAKQVKRTAARTRRRRPPIPPMPGFDDFSRHGPTCWKAEKNRTRPGAQSELLGPAPTLTG